MKKYLPYLLIMLIPLLVSCNKDEGPDPCEGKKPDEFYCDPNYYWLRLHEIGDTLTFKKYKKKYSDSTFEYIYQGIETYIATDTILERVAYERNKIGAQCFNYLYRNEIVTIFNGPETLKLRLVPEGYADKSLSKFS